MLAALGRAQLSRLDEMIEARRQHRLSYAALFADVPGVTLFGEPSESDDGATRDNFWLTSILVEPSVAGFTRDDLMARPLWKPMHLQPVFATSRAYINCTSQRLFETGLSLPSGSVLNGQQLSRIHAIIAAFVTAQPASSAAGGF